jgi:hypothetical protein
VKVLIACEFSGIVRDAFAARVPTRNERILEHGYEAYAREEGHYDTGDQ